MLSKIRNRAKCKKCQSIIESFFPTDLVFCACREIAVEGGEAMKCMANEWSNFLRVDDEGNEIIPTIREVKDSSVELEVPHRIHNKSEILKVIDHLIDTLNDLPPHALATSLTQYDQLAMLTILGSILKADLEEVSHV